MFIVMWQNETGSDMIEEVETMEDAKAAAAKYYSDNDREDVKDDTVVVFANTPGTEDFQYPEPIETWSIEDFE